MRAFIDTSTLAKKYKEEPGRDKFLLILKTVDEVVVAPVTYIELICLVRRDFEEFRRKEESFLKLKQEIDLDFSYFYKIPFNEELEQTACQLRHKYALRALDLIQLSSAKISQAKIFLTSDKFLHKMADQELKHSQVEFIG